MMKKHHKGGRKWQEKLEEANLLNKFKDTIRLFCMISHTLNLDKFLFPTINFLHLPPPSLITRVGIHLLQSKFTFVLIFHEGNISLLSRFIFFFKLWWFFYPMDFDYDICDIVSFCLVLFDYVWSNYYIYALTIFKYKSWLAFFRKTLFNS